MNSTRVQVAIVSGIVALGGLVMLAQAPREQREGPPTAAQLKDAVSRLRGNRIATPNDYDKLTLEQKKYVESILSGPRSDISGPLGVMMVSPALGDLNQKAIAYARFAGREGFSTVPPKLNELAIMMSAAFWRSEFVWLAHRRAAQGAGLNPAVGDAIAAGQRPAMLQPDEEAVYNFCDELLNRRQVSDATFAKLKDLLGERGIVDLTAAMGYFQYISMMLDVDRYPLPNNVKPQLKPLP